VCGSVCHMLANDRTLGPCCRAHAACSDATRDETLLIKFISLMRIDRRRSRVKSEPRPRRTPSQRQPADRHAVKPCRRVVHGLGWVDPWVGLGRDFSVFGGFGWIHHNKSTKNLKALCINAFKTLLGKIWLYQTVKFVSCIGLGRVGSKFSHL